MNQDFLKRATYASLDDVLQAKAYMATVRTFVNHISKVFEASFEKGMTSLIALGTAVGTFEHEDKIEALSMFKAIVSSYTGSKDAVAPFLVLNNDELLDMFKDILSELDNIEKDMDDMIAVKMAEHTSSCSVH